MKATFCVDASQKLGTGHVMRCLTLASAMRERGYDCHFISRDLPGNLIKTVREHGYVCTALPAPLADQFEEYIERNWENHAAQTIAAIGSHITDWLIVDHYEIDAKWERALRSSAKKLLVIDDLADRIHDCDILLDQTIGAAIPGRYDNLIPEKCHTLLGTSHVLLRPEFDLPLARKRSGIISHIHVFFGGNDSTNQAGKVASALSKFNGITAEITLGIEHLFRSEIMASSAEHENIKVHEICNNMRAAMEKADLGIGVCGMAAWERCAIGLPALVSITAENQRADTQALHELGVVQSLGNAVDLDVGDWFDAITALVAEPDRLISMSKSAQLILDGHEINRHKLIEMMDSHES